MFKRGEFYLNPITGECAVIRIGTDESHGERLLVDLYIRPCGRVAARHMHPVINEKFTMVSGKITFFLDGVTSIAEPGKIVDIPAGVVHDFWNAGDGWAHAIVDIQPAARFEAFIRNGFGLACEAKTNAKGMPNLLQLSLMALEFDDVIRFARPPRFLQHLIFFVLAPIAHLLGYKGSYDKYLVAGPHSVGSLESFSNGLPARFLFEDRTSHGSL